MTCPECGAEQLAFPVPEDLRKLLPEEPTAATICTRCLSFEPADGASDELPDFTTISDAFPNNREAAAPLALAVGLLADSLALYRREIGTLLERTERAGTDPLLAIDRLAADPDLDPAFDWDRRQPQLEQLLYE